ncbi:hypothetical protein F3Y22_tig00117016pilonHSYRG00039 [Hibiscus syriacus]|uniref:Uncharacterized protein n=1 Tax=Hibiscus syriacus TaxID=106335 RepID=A0A6A2XPM4_HIBSY|nr:hypothetical protein F3Y22_tig00117016pilonHSYRG00039 [Hibiscus syriacus]
MKWYNLIHVIIETVLAAWMRLKYPHLAVGELVSSAPILQFKDIVQAETFYNIVFNFFNVLSHSWKVVAVLILLESHLHLRFKRRMAFGNCLKLSACVGKNNGRIGICAFLYGVMQFETLGRELKSVQDLTDWLDSAYLAMVNYPYPANLIMPLPAHPVREVCRKIDGSPPDSSILEHIFNGACTKMVMPMASDGNNSMFPAYDWDYSAFREGVQEGFPGDTKAWMDNNGISWTHKRTIRYFMLASSLSLHHCLVCTAMNEW